MGGMFEISWKRWISGEKLSARELALQNCLFDSSVGIRIYFSSLIAHCLGWDFGSEEDIRTGDGGGGGSDSIRTRLFVPVSTSGIDMAIAGLESMEDH